MTSVDLSERFQSQDYSFSGNFAQKLAATNVGFKSSPNVDFIPVEVLTEFPHLNGIEIARSNTFTIIKNGLFTKNFAKLQYLYLGENSIQTIEANAFQYLVSLKWISLHTNQIQSLPFPIFKNNPKLIFISLYGNKINSMNSNIFKNLKKLKFVGLAGGNVCVNKTFGCYSSNCVVSQSDLDRDLATCYSNCKNNMECSLRSGNFELLNPSYVEANIDAIVSYGHLDVLIKQNYVETLIKKGYLDLMVENGFLDSLVAQNYLDPLIQNGHLDLLIEKGYTDLLIEKGYKNKIIESDWRLKLAYKDINQATDSEMKSLKQELADLKEEIKSLKNKIDKFEMIIRP